jgi:hypothetical protein
MERDETALLPGIWVGAVLEQDTSHGRMSAGRRAVKRLHTERIPRNRAHIGAAFEQRRGDFFAPEERCEVERRETVGRPLGGGARLHGQQLTDAFGVSHGRRLEDREVGPLGQDRLDRVAITAIERLQQLRLWARQLAHATIFTGRGMHIHAMWPILRRKKGEAAMNQTAASLWQLVRDDHLVRRGAWISLGIVWLAAAWADLRMLIFIPAVAGAVWVLMRRRGELPDDDWL